MIEMLALASTLLLRAQAAADSAPLVLDLNLPAFRLELHEPGLPIERFSVAIGSPRYPTPRGDYSVTVLELNPEWNPPESPWAVGSVPMVPGPANPMGRAKMMFKPLYFIHGTPDTASIGQAVSHGCVRLLNADALKLAARVLRAGVPHLDELQRAQLLESTSTSDIRLTHVVRAQVRYELLEIMAGQVVAYPDVYRLRSATTDSVAQALIERAVAPAEAVPGIARKLLDSARAGPVRAPIDAVISRSREGP